MWKMSFSCLQLACRILKDKKTLLDSPKFRDIRISDDATLSQLEFLKGLRRELKFRQNRGELDITIKYVKGESVIVNVHDDVLNWRQSVYPESKN